MNMHKTHQTLYFGDLHFHTHYSDNRDRASIEEMILAGTRHQLSIFGTADHNHNLDAEKWRSTQAESVHLRDQYPDIVLLNNCEITFLLGHLNVLLPEGIEGTISEGYQYLYRDPHALKIINHPFPTTDEWHTRIIPDAIGIEVINGAVFTHLQQQGYAIRSAIDIPSVHTYAVYLALNLPVAAIGSSDAHCRAEIGYGMTGFRMSDKADTASVIRAIREHRTFATTRCGIVPDWSFDAEVGVLSWNIEWSTGDTTFDDGVTVEVYCGDQRVHISTEQNGTFSVKRAGLYWIAAFNGYNIAISSPSKVGNTRAVREGLTQILNTGIHYIRQDLTWLSLATSSPSEPIARRGKQEANISIMSSVDAPNIVDRYGNTVSYKVIDRSPARVIIEKECDAQGFEEFYIWLTRNELHEYVFADIDYHKEKHVFFFSARLLPKKMMHGEQLETCYRDDRENIWTLLDEQTHCKVYVATLPALRLRLQFESTGFPCKISNISPGIDSMLVYVEEEAACPVHIQDRVQKGIQDMGKRPLQDKIYQLFEYAG